MGWGDCMPGHRISHSLGRDLAGGVSPLPHLVMSLFKWAAVAVIQAAGRLP